MPLTENFKQSDLICFFKQIFYRKQSLGSPVTISPMKNEKQLVTVVRFFLKLVMISRFLSALMGIKTLD